MNYDITTPATRRRSRTINRPVDITAYYFQDGSRCYPRQIELDGHELPSFKSGLRGLVRAGQRMVEVFTMTDGRAQYSLQFEPNNRTWTLMSISRPA